MDNVQKIQQKEMILSDEMVEVGCEFLKSLAHPIRLKILCLLQLSEMSVGELQNHLKTSTANISQHLAIMRHSKIITSRKDANYIYNRIADPKIVEFVEKLKEICIEKSSK